jgi:signal transduction histidine kinase
MSLWHRTWQALYPRTLFGQVALIVCGGLAVAHVLTFWLIVREREAQSVQMMMAYVGRDVATSVAILDRLPAIERASWLPRLARQNYHYSLGAPALGPHSTQRPLATAMPAATHALAGPITAAVATQLGAQRVGTMQQGPAGQGGLHLLLPLQLSDGSALSVHLSPAPNSVSRSTVALLVLQLGGLATASWLSVRMAARPLRRLAQAADAIKPGHEAAPMDESGPREVAQAARAFNNMQSRIDAHLAERMQLLAAISHDLQTPITRLRLRADLLPDAALRQKILADLADMQSLVEEGLTYARTAQAVQEPPQPVDLYALLDGLVCDAMDAGHRVELVGHSPGPVTTRVQALRRVVVNLLDNALKFGGNSQRAPGEPQAQVRIEAKANSLHITVRDWGLGIPPDQLQAVIQPFYRLETSRNRDTGGTGLGLAIAQQLAQALGGQLELVNRHSPGGLAAHGHDQGLDARLTLALPGGTHRPAP